MLEILLTFLLLCVLQAVLGFDNLLYISIESKRAPEADQARVRRMGIGIAVVLRIVLLVVILALLKQLTAEWFSIGLDENHQPKEGAWISGAFDFGDILTLFGGAFIIYTATKEVLHMMTLEEEHAKDRKPSSVAKIVGLIVTMNLVFSFDSILSAIALTNPDAVDPATGEVIVRSHEIVMGLSRGTWAIVSMVIAIILSGVLMIWLADKVSTFLQKNRMYEVLGLFVLFVVGIMLVTEGAHKAHLSLFGNPVHAMTKTTFYFVIAVLLFTDIVQGRYLKKLARVKKDVHGEI